VGILTPSASIWGMLSFLNCPPESVTIEFCIFRVQTAHMRILLTIIALTFFFGSRAQKYLPTDPIMGVGPALSFTPYSLGPEINSIKNWQVRPYTGFSAGYIFSGRGGASYLSAQTGLMLLKPLNNNFSAFAGVSVAPTYIIGSLPYSPLPNQAGNNFNGLNLNMGISGGLIYTNDARTFSISGSVSVERYSYPVYTSRPPSNGNIGKGY
jgi:hypothetical protein